MARTAWDGLRGHDPVRAAFERAMQAGRLTHGYIFAGPEGIGKLRFARGLAQALLCQTARADTLEPCGVCHACRSFLAASHPDFHLVQREPGKRELTVDKFLGAKEQRGKTGLCHDLSLRPQAGSRKVAVLDDADTMNDEAANALLKTLEEPPERAVLILIVHNAAALLPTIRSRCQFVRFDPLSDTIVAELLLEQGVAENSQEAASIAALADGSLTIARQLASPACRALRNQVFAALTQANGSGMLTAKELTEAIEAAASDVPEQRLFAGWALRTAVEFYRSALWRAASPQATGITLVPEAVRWIDQAPNDLDFAVERLGSLIERCQLATEHLEQNVGVGLCLEAAFSELVRPFAPK